MAPEEELLHLFDSYWFEYQIFSSTKPKPRPNFSAAPAANDPVLVKVHEGLEPQKAAYKQLLPRTPSLISRSLSDQALSSKDSFHSSENSAADSPKSVLVPKLETVLSGKEVEEFSQPPPREAAAYERFDKKPIIRSGRRRKGSSKSLSELEFEELKGFMDLGFVFSDEDKDSSLVSILPGLQRLGGSQKSDDNESTVSRPYLSEAWEVFDHQKRRIDQDPLMNWKIPAFGNELELKDHLRFWAHSVASAVR